MFSIGNKIVITSSSIKTGRIGPRSGSMGYIKNISPFSIDIGPYFIINASIIFYKFGNEKKYRIEHRSTPFILPKQMKTIADFSFSSQQSFLRKVSKNNKLKQQLKNLFNTKFLYTISPSYDNNEKNMSVEERKAYLSSLWTSININKCLSNIQNIQWYDRYKKPDIKNIVNILQKGIIESSYKQTIIQNIMKGNKNDYKNFIKTIKFLNLKYTEVNKLDAPYYDENTSSVQNNLDKIYRLLFVNLFNIHYKTLSKTYIETQTSQKSKLFIKNIINNLNYVKYRVINIGQKHSLYNK